MSFGDRSFTLAFAHSVRQIPATMWLPEQQKATDHVWMFNVSLDKLRRTSPLHPDVVLDESLLDEGRRGVIGTFEATINEGLGRLAVDHDGWEFDTAQWSDYFWPDHLPVPDLPLSVYGARDKVDVDPETIPGYEPLLAHPLEPIMGSANREVYIGSKKAALLAKGFQDGIESGKEAEFLDAICSRRRPSGGTTELYLSERSQAEWDMYRFLRDGTLATAQLGGIVLFKDIEWYERIDNGPGQNP